MAENFNQFMGNRRQQQNLQQSPFGSMLAGMDAPAGKTGELTQGQYSLRDILADVARNLYGGSDPKAGAAFGSKVADLGYMTPGVGQVMSGGDALQAMQRGDKGGAALAALGAIPAAGPEVRAAGQLERGAAKAGREALAETSAPLQKVEGTWGVRDRPDVKFEGASPHEFTPGQWGRMGEAYGAHNIGPLDEDAWYNSLQPFESKSGQTFHAPGGLEDKTPFTYFDDLYMKAQGINPNDLTPAQHLAIHNRTVAGKQAPPEGFTDANIFNQLGGMGLLSPNNPLTPNEFAAAAVAAKGSGKQDLFDISQAAGQQFDFGKHPMFGGEPDPFHGEANRRVLSNQITERLGTQGAEKGGSGVSGNQDYTTLVGLAQMMREKPEFFRFKGAGEGSANESDQWLNFVDRLQSQVPGLAGKTGSFGGVWQDPVKAATSAMDRHMLNTFRDKVFESPDEMALWERQTLNDWNNPKPPKPVKGEAPQAAPVREQASTIDEMRSRPGGTNFFNDKIFGYVNKSKEGQMRLARTGDVNPNTPAHLRPENADYVKEPQKFVSMGPAMRRGIEANKASKEASGATGVFSDQWRVWDPIRQRFEPHEINQPGLTQLPRMSEAQHAAALKEHADLGYLNYSKDPQGNLQPVRPSLFGDASMSPQREKMKAMLKGIDPSKLAYFSLLLGLPAGAAGALGSSEDQKGS